MSDRQRLPFWMKSRWWQSILPLGIVGALLVVTALLGNFGCANRATSGEIHFADGLEQLALGDTAQALALLQQARWELDNDHRVLFHIGRIQAAATNIESRVRARETLLQAIDRSPDSAEYRQSLGALLQRQRYPLASTRMLAQAVRLDPGLSGAWVLLGQNIQDNYFQSMDQPALLDSAINCYVNALMHDPEDRQAAYRLAFLHMHNKELDVARGIVLPIVAQSACPDRFGMLLTAIEYRAHRFERSAEVVARTLECMDWPQREEWVGLQSILRPDSTALWEDKTPAQRDSLAQWFWWNADPTPTTVANERFLEHVTRVVEADFYFSVFPLGKPGTRTDRGEMWLRYGEPKLQVRAYTSRDGMWRWIYLPERGSDIGATFDFVDTYHNGDYQRVRRGVWADYAYPDIFAELPVASSLEFAGPPGGMQYQMRYFRGRNGKTAVEIAFAVSPAGGWPALLVEAAAWRGPQDRAAFAGSVAQKGQLHKLADGRLLGRLRFEVPAETLVLGLQATTIAEDAAVVDLEKRHAAQWVAMGRDTLHIEDLHGDALAISDIMLAYQIRESPGGLFDVGGVQVIPRVDARIVGSDLNLYFEVYPSQEILRAQQRIAVRYAVRARPPEKFGFWEQFKPGARSRWDPAKLPTVQASYFFEPGNQVEPQQLRIDLSALDAGPYELRVELEEQRSGTVASRVVPFLLLERPGI